MYHLCQNKDRDAADILKLIECCGLMMESGGNLSVVDINVSLEDYSE
jgi:hypothetical protein